ncbi:uncharacterized protein LOC130949176 [Arachis stenosperma]|uniref:uncharacterized protein LOC130949176 n=1 Tax=Arachis stenosperma TaxID=217475 RepID=UPI0025ABF514|nr:uncharacterized protein LOC130949176 [Arachis stenosperma]
MKKARKNIEGSEREKYAELRDYLNQILLSNLGSTVHLDTILMPDSLPLFKRVYISFEACKKGFVLGCRPFIGLDGTFLKGFYGGQLLTAIGQDANNQIFPIAYAVMLETRDNWKWFLDHLNNDLGNYMVHGWNFISDQQRLCLEFIIASVLCIFGIISQRDGRTNNSKGYLNKLDLKNWTKANFSEWPKVDNVTNNNCETFNGKIVKYRGKPIITMLEEVRTYVMRIVARNKKILSGYIGTVAPRQLSRLEREKEETNKWTPTWSGDDAEDIYEVEKHPTKLTGLPCRHACAALALRGRKPEEQIHDWLGMHAYNTAYQMNINHSGHNNRTCQQKKDDTLDEEVALVAKAAAAAAKSQNQPKQNTGEPTSEVNVA